MLVTSAIAGGEHGGRAKGSIAATHAGLQLLQRNGSRSCTGTYSYQPRGLTAMLIGSETKKVLTHTVIPVLVYR
jgi:nucleotide-binding universal stress UspA family protein